MNKTHRYFLVVPVIVVLCLIAQACNNSQVAQTLNLIIAGVDVALPLVEATGVVPVPAGSLITHYLSAASTAVSTTAAELDSTDTNVQKVDKIGVIFSQVVLPEVPGLTPDQLAKVQSVDAAVHAFLNALGAAQPGQPRGLARARAAKAPNVKLTVADQAKLVEIRAHAENDKALLSVAAGR